MPNLQEIWKDIPGYEGIYQVSNLGRIKSSDMKVPSSYGATRVMKGRIRKQSLMPNGYLHIALYKETKFIQVYVHRVIAEVFCVKRPEGKNFVNHIDGNKQNNIASNLEWVDHAENMAHARANNLLTPVRGEQIGKAILTEQQARRIKELCKTKTTQEIIELLGIDRSKRHLVANIRCGRIWKHI